MAQIRTAIEVTEREARVLQVRQGKERQIRHAVRIPLPPAAELDPQTRAKTRAEALRDGLKAAGIRVASAVVVIPKRNATLRYAVLPSTEDAELGKMARFEAERHIPFNAQRHVVSHCVMRKDGLQGSHVLLAAIDAPELDEIKELSAVGGFDIEAVDISSLGHYNVLTAQAPAEFRDQTVGYLHVGLFAADITIVSQGMLLFTRSVPYGIERLLAELRELLPEGRTLTPADLRTIDLLHPAEGLQRLGLCDEAPAADASSVFDVGAEPARIETQCKAEVILRDWLNRLGIEIQRSYEFAQRELDCAPITTLVVAGEVAQWPHFKAYIQASLSVETHAFSSLNGLEKPGVEIPESHGFLAAAGALARYWKPAALAVNLSPPNYRAKSAILRRRRSIMLTALLALGLFVLGYVYLSMAADVRQERIQALREANRKLAPLADELLDREKQLAIIEDFQSDKRSAMAILDTISAKDYLPRRVSITRFDYNKGDYVNIQGYALSPQDLTQFEIDLREATYQNEKIFRGGVIKKAQEFGQRLPDRNEDLVKFSIDGRISED